MRTALLSGTRLTRPALGHPDLSRIEAGKMTPGRGPPSACPRSWIRSTRTFLLACREKGLALRIVCGPEVPDRLLGDELRLRQVLYNLVGNAVKFTDRGWVELSVTLSPGAPRGFGRVRITVADSGIGIPEEARERIFESFTQAEGSFARRYQGAGLGLSIVRSLVELMGGDLALDSEPGRGTTFRCDLVLRLDTSDADGAARSEASGRPGRSLRILLAEDDRVNQVATGRLLEKLGHRVTVAPDGIRALEALEAEDFDCVLLDIQMPVARRPGHGGTHPRCRPLRAQGWHPVIALTAHAMSGDRASVSWPRAWTTYLSKPLDRASLDGAWPGVVAGLGSRARARVAAEGTRARRPRDQGRRVAAWGRAAPGREKKGVGGMMTELRKFLAPEDSSSGRAPRAWPGATQEQTWGPGGCSCLGPGPGGRGLDRVRAHQPAGRGLQVSLYLDVSPNPRDHEVMAGAERYGRDGCD